MKSQKSKEEKRMVNSLKNENGNLDLAIWVLVIEGIAISATWESRNQISKGSINDWFKKVPGEM